MYVYVGGYGDLLFRATDWRTFGGVNGKVQLMGEVRMKNYSGEVYWKEHDEWFPVESIKGSTNSIDYDTHEPPKGESWSGLLQEIKDGELQLNDIRDTASCIDGTMSPSIEIFSGPAFNSESHQISDTDFLQEEVKALSILKDKTLDKLSEVIFSNKLNGSDVDMCNQLLTVYERVQRLLVEGNKKGVCK